MSPSSETTSGFETRVMNAGLVGHDALALAALAGALTVSTTAPDADLWRVRGSTQVELELAAQTPTMAELLDIEVDGDLELSFEEAVRRGREAARNIPETLIDIDF